MSIAYRSYIQSKSSFAHSTCSCENVTENEMMLLLKGPRHARLYTERTSRTHKHTHIAHGCDCFTVVPHYFSIFCFWLWHLQSYLSLCARAGWVWIMLVYCFIIDWIINIAFHGNNRNLSLHIFSYVHNPWMQWTKKNEKDNTKNTSSSFMEREKTKSMWQNAHTATFYCFISRTTSKRKIWFFCVFAFASILSSCAQGAHIGLKPNTRTIETFEHGLCEKRIEFRAKTNEQRERE